MLKFMRKHATSYLIKGMFGLIIIVFIFWGVGSFRGKGATVAEVGPYKVSMEEYQDSYRRLINIYRMIYKEKFDDNLLRELKLKEKALDDVINKYILLVHAKKVGISVSDSEFYDYLTGIEAFRRDGMFNREVYAQTLKRNGIDQKRFEQSERVNIITSKMMKIIKDNGALVGDNDMWEDYAKSKGKINLAYLVFDPSQYMNKAEADEKDVEEIYKKEKDFHRSENLYMFRYLIIDEKTRLKDDQVYTDLLKARNMDAYAKKNGLSIFTMDGIKESELAKRFPDMKTREWFKTLKKGEISLPVREGSKSYIFQLVDVEEGKPFSKDVVSQQIRERLKKEKAVGIAREKAEGAIRAGTMEGAKETGFISRSSATLPGIGMVPQEYAGILGLAELHKFYNKPVPVNGKYYVFALKGIMLPDKKDWAKEKTEYGRFFESREKADSYKSIMEQLRNKEKIKIDWKNI